MKLLPFSHVSRFIFVAMILRFLKYKDKVFSSFLNYNLSFFLKLLLVLAKNGRHMMKKD